MIYRETPSGFPVWQGEPVGEDQVSYSKDIETLWSADALEAVGLWRDDMIAPQDDVPWHKRSLGRAIRRVDGVVKWDHDLEDQPLDALKGIRLAELAARRWEIETGGVTVGGLTVPSDRDTQGRIAQIVAAYDKGFVTGQVLFKLAPGVHIEIDEVAIRAVMEAGAQLIQSCFRREGELAALIAAAPDLAALEAIDIQGFWA
jgi:hypothetical protein